MKTCDTHKMGGEFTGQFPYYRMIEFFKYLKKDKADTTIFVVSALAQVTRMLQEIFEAKVKENTPDAMKILGKIKEMHLERTKDLLIKDINFLFDYLPEIEYFVKEGSINSNQTITKAHILKFGELMSSEIIYRFLKNQREDIRLIDARKIIKCHGEDYCQAEVSFENSIDRINRSIEKCNRTITQGYIGSSLDDNDMVMGFDSSDFTAAVITKSLIIQNPLGKHKLTYWKNVDGVKMGGEFVKYINYFDFMGLETTPVRKDSIEILSRYRPEVIIRSFLNLENPGTTIVWR